MRATVVVPTFDHGLGVRLELGDLDTSRQLLVHRSPARSRPMIIRWTWFVPSTIWRALASRM